MIKNDTIKHIGNEWILFNKAGTKELGRFKTEKEAKKREREIQYFKHKKDEKQLTKTGKKLSKLSAPLGIERDYQGRIRNLVIRYAKIINENIVKNLPTILGQVNAIRPDSNSDGIGDDVNSLFIATRLQMANEITEYEIDKIIQSTALEMNSWNKAQITMVLKQGLGIDVFIPESWLAEQLNIFVINNVNLITNVRDSFINQTETIVYDGMRRGLRHEEIAKQILGTGKDELGRVSRFREAKTRANLIGRDQVNKLNGNLTHLRQTSIGVTNYFWRGVKDTRERHSHLMREGQRYSWKKGSEIGTHPGDEIQCRCYAEPDLSDLLK